MHIRCPHCQNPIELVDDSPLNDVNCPSCGSNFSLANEETVSERAATKWIAHFELLEQVGLGAFGSVWRAKDTQLDRLVAVKLPRKDQLTAEEQEQFLREARAAAQLRHPNIVSVYEVGRDGESIYIVSDFVQGATLAEWLESQRLTTHEAVRLMIDICEAVQHAHDKGVIHRDLKPGNILMDLEGRPHVTDFGLAKRESGEITMTVDGRILGTPAYMSPEQARGEGHDADRRSDVYSLGVILFQLLTGELPFRGNPRMLIVQILKDEPPSPRKLNNAISRDLETITLKCLEKDASRRYPTAQALADELRRVQRQEPIQARPIGRVERGWRWCKRQPVVAGLAAAVMLSLSIGIGVSTWQAIQASIARDSAELARKKAEAAQEKTMVALRSATDDVVERLIGAKETYGPDERAYLESALKRWQTIADEQADSTVGRSMQAEGAFRVARLQTRLGDRNAALANYRVAVDKFRDLIEIETTQPTFQHDLASTYNDLGNLLVGLGDNESARVAYANSLGIRNGLVTQFPAIPHYKDELATSFNNFGNLLDVQGQHSAALLAYEDSIKNREQLIEQFPAVSEYQFALADTHYNRGILLAGIGEHEAACSAHDTGIDILGKLMTQFPAVSLYRRAFANNSHSLGFNLDERGQESEALVAYKTSLDVRQGLVAQYPAVPAFAQELAQSQISLGNSLSAAEEKDEARAALEGGLEILRRLAAQFPDVPEYQDELGFAYLNLGILMKDSGEQSKALGLLQSSVNTLRSLVEQFPNVPEYDADLAFAYNSLGALRSDIGEQSGARDAYNASIEICQQLADCFPGVIKYRVRLGICYCNLGILESTVGEHRRCLNALSMAVDLLSGAYDIESPDDAVRNGLFKSLRSRAMAFGLLKQHTEAVKDWDRVVELSPPMDQLQSQASRAISKVKAGMATEAVAEVTELTKNTQLTAEQWRDFACVYSLASVKLQDKQQEYADRAMELLHKAVEAGFHDVEQLKTDADLALLRERQDFQKLIADLEAAKTQGAIEP